MNCPYEKTADGLELQSQVVSLKKDIVTFDNVHVQNFPVYSCILFMLWPPECLLDPPPHHEHPAIHGKEKS